jgi:DNA-binding transcriptional MerR regulator
VSDLLIPKQAVKLRRPSAHRPSSPDLYRTKEVVQILGISRRQLQYWAQTDLVEPSVKTPGGHHRYSFADLVALKATKRLIDSGVSVQRIRESIRSLRRILPRVEQPLSELVLVATGDVVLVFLNGSVFEAVSGQEWVFEVCEFQREVEAWKLRNQAEQEGSARVVRRSRPLDKSA